MSVAKELLGEISVEQFLSEFWQKKPLLVRAAVPGFAGLLSRDALFGLAGQDNVTARMVRKTEAGWTLTHGPFRKRDFPAKKSAELWTILVQELNHHLTSADELLNRFNFIPHARLDDLMVSYAVPGGGVGPHFDSYDVFLLQGHGRRRWQIGSQQDLTLIPGLPLKILQHFEVEQEWVLEPGDMLYLPPSYAHNGIAVDECTTYSIGFRAPTSQEIATQFLVYLQDRIELPGMYADPDLQLQAHPGEIGEAMMQQLSQMIDQIRWDQDDVTNFTGCYLTEPKAHIFFDAPDELPSLPALTEMVARHGIRLAPQSRLLFYRNKFFLNGEAVELGESGSVLLVELADSRCIAPRRVSDAEAEWLLTGLADGYLVL